MGYTYRGNEHDAQPPMPSRPSCGKRSGYILHLRYDEDACQPCRDANAAYQSEWSQRTKKVPA